MPEILRLFSIQSVLLPNDIVPWHRMSLVPALNQLNEHYSFNQLGPELDETGNLKSLTGVGGQFILAEKAIPVPRMKLGANLLEFQVEGDSSVADAFFADLAALLQQIAESPNLKIASTSPILATYQTIAVVRLAVAAESLLSPRLLSFMESTALPALHPQKGQAEIALAHLSWAIQYQSRSADAAYLPKVLTIEPRAGTPAGEQVYFTQSPIRSEDHLGLLEEFENALAPPDRQRPKPGKQRAVRLR